MAINKKRLLLIITNRYAATNVIHSGLIKCLAEEYEVYLISDLLGQTEIQEINRHFNVTTYKIDIKIPVESRSIKLLRLLEKALFYHFFNIETQKFKIAERGIWFRLFLQVTLGFTEFLGLSKILLRFLRAEILRRTGNDPLLNPLLAYNFSGVLSSSPLDIRENSIVNFLKKNNVTALAMIISWDNLTSKGVINANHDHVLVWNEIMKNEYSRFYAIFNVSNQNIYPTGIPRFDLYFKDIEGNRSKAEFYKRFQIAGNAKIILFATSSITHFPNQTDIVKHLLEYSSQNQNTKIIIRCHPSDNSERYRQFENHPDLSIYPLADLENAGFHFSQIPGLDTLYDLYEMLKYCHVCVNIASTIRLEAAVCNKPGISIAYDGDLKVPFHKSVRRFYAYAHQIPLNAIEIDKLVFSKKELFNALHEALQDSSGTTYDYARGINKFVHHSGPFAVSTTVKQIRQWLT